MLGVVPAQTPPPGVQRAVLAVAAVLAVVVFLVVERRAGRRPVATLRERFLLGVPWGTLTAVAVVVAVYLFVQGGWSHWYNPVVVPFRAWSYLAPLGMVTAAFGHVGPGHLIGNLVGTVTVAPLVEYVWGHYPEERGTSLFGSLRSNPYARAFLLFPGGVILVGLATALFALGPVIGFSGVVFAFVGFAVVYYPLGTVVALSAGSVVRLAYRAFQRPSLTASGRPAYITPWWADIAIQGHALGLLLGVVVAGVLARRRTAALPAPGRLLFGALLVAVGQNLWAVYWFLGGGEYVLFRAVGLGLVIVLAVVIAGLAADTDEADDSADRRDSDGPDDTGDSGDELADTGAADDHVTADDDTVGPTPTRADGAGDDESRDQTDGTGDDESRDQTDGTDSPDESAWRRLRENFAFRPLAVWLLLLVLAVLAGAAVPANLFAVSDEPLPGDPVEVRGYSVTYAEGVQNGMVSVVNVSAFGYSTDVTTSGVVVRNPRSNVWTTATSKGRLAFAGQQEIVLGGVGWRETVTVTRRGFSAAGGGTAYRVTLRHDDTERLAFVSEPARANPRVAGWNVSVAANETGFRLLLTDGNRSANVSVPTGNQTVTAGGVAFVRDGSSVFAVVGEAGNETRVKVAARETYRDTESS
ncbi:MAG: rhomboid family intramembrane serine protease, partial [Halobaculum sp.]